MSEQEHGTLFFDTLRRVDKGGKFLKACDNELRQAVQLTQERGGKATLTIKLVVKLAQGKQMVVEPSVAASVPKPMTLDDPDQMQLDLDAPKKVVPAPVSDAQADYAAPRKVSVKTN